jgi:hypothetical protein
MKKLIEKYCLQPSLNNARKLRAYERSHPVSLAAMSVEDRDTLAEAIHHANKGSN